MTYSPIQLDWTYVHLSGISIKWFEQDSISHISHSHTLNVPDVERKYNPLLPMSTYIKLEDVQKILSKTSDKYQSEYTWWWIAWKILEDINSLPSISFEEMIKEMMEKVRKSDDPYELDLPDYRNNPTASLQEILNKLP